MKGEGVCLQLLHSTHALVSQQQTTDWETSSGCRAEQQQHSIQHHLRPYGEHHITSPQHISCGLECSHSVREQQRLSVVLIATSAAAPAFAASPKLRAG